MQSISSTLPVTTTITAVVKLTGGLVRIDHLFYLISVWRNGSEEPRDGAILSVRYDDMVRGFKKAKFFKNNILIDMSVDGKNINFKLSPKSIHICGANTVGMIQRGCNLLIAIIHQTQHKLSALLKDPDHTEKCLDWVSKAIRGPTVQVILQDDGYIELTPERHRRLEATGQLAKLTGIRPFQLIQPCILPIPEELNSEVCKAYLELSADYPYWEKYEHVLNEVIPKMDSILHSEAGPHPEAILSIESIDLKMVNRQFKLNITIHKANLAIAIAHFDVALCGFYQRVAEQIGISTLEQAAADKHGDKAYRFLYGAYMSSQAYRTAITTGTRFPYFPELLELAERWIEATVEETDDLPLIQFVCDFDNVLDSYIKVLVFHLDDNDKEVHHTFMIQPSGKITQSSSSNQSLEQIRQLLLKFIDLYRDYINAQSEALRPVI